MAITEESPSERQRGYSRIRGQLIILGLFRFSEALAWSTIFPYAFFMMQSFLPASPSRDAKAAAFASTTVALFTFGEFLMSVAWAKASDRFGRKPTLMTGVVGGCASALAFGVSGSLGMAMAARAFGGLVNPNVGVISACVGELVERKGDQGRAFSVVPFLRGLGSLVGPVIGGHLADPVKTMPSIFHVGSIWETYPYLLPNLIVALFIAGSGILGLFLLEETHPKFRDNGQILRGNITSWIRGMVKALRGQADDEKYTALSSTEDEIELPSRADVEHAGAEEDVSLSSVSSQQTDTSSPSAWSKQVILQILAVSILAFHKVSSDVIIPIFLATDAVPSKDSSNEHKRNSKFRAGFGMASPGISNILLSQAIVAIIAQVLIVPWVISRWGPLKSFRWTLFCFPWLYCFTPFTASLLSPFSTITILLDLWIKGFLVNIGYVASAILVTNTSPALIHLATINGAAASD
ncbi:hypothetical protein FQN52_007307 [Onygenales sp. PD_12]|nr:hypothetical protein FQN52_007307 [Onygenales sp. PD_12]